MKRIILLLIISFVCTACDKDKVASAPTHTMEAIEVQVETTPEKIHADEEITIKATVTQGKEQVDDANEVKFEIWKQGEANHKMLDAIHQSDGIYAIETSFAEEGTYNIIAHTSARDLHVMPEIELTVN